MAKAKTTAVTGVNKWDEELAAMAAEASGQEIVSSSFLSTRGGRLSYKGNEVPDNKMNVVILAAVHENLFYTDRYDPENPAPPVCYAFGEHDKGLEPHEEATEKQSADCASCPNNVFGSADSGKGKACKNSRRLTLLTEDDLEDVGAAELAQLKIPVTSVKNWSNYVSTLANTMKRPPFAVVTEISVIPDSKTQFKVCFKPVGQITDGEVLPALMDRRPAALEAMMQPYPAPQPKPEPPARGARPAAGANAKGRKY